MLINSCKFAPILSHNRFADRVISRADLSPSDTTFFQRQVCPRLILYLE